MKWYKNLLLEHYYYFKYDKKENIRVIKNIECPTFMRGGVGIPIFDYSFRIKNMIILNNLKKEPVEETEVIEKVGAKNWRKFLEWKDEYMIGVIL